MTCETRCAVRGPWVQSAQLALVVALFMFVAFVFCMYYSPTNASNVYKDVRGRKRLAFIGMESRQAPLQKYHKQEDLKRLSKGRGRRPICYSRKRGQKESNQKRSIAQKRTTKKCSTYWVEKNTTTRAACRSGPLQQRLGRRHGVQEELEAGVAHVEHSRLHHGLVETAKRHALDEHPRALLVGVQSPACISVGEGRQSGKHGERSILYSVVITFEATGPKS